MTQNLISMKSVRDPPLTQNGFQGTVAIIGSELGYHPEALENDGLTHEGSLDISRNQDFWMHLNKHLVKSSLVRGKWSVYKNSNVSIMKGVNFLRKKLTSFKNSIQAFEGNIFAYVK